MHRSGLTNELNYRVATVSVTTNSPYFNSNVLILGADGFDLKVYLIVNLKERLFFFQDNMLFQNRWRSGTKINFEFLIKL